MWTYETSIEANASATTAYRRWSELVVPPDGSGNPRTDPPRDVSVESHAPGARLLFEHRIDLTTDGVRLTETVTIEGPLTRLYMGLVGGRLKKAQAGSLQRVKEEAEALGGRRSDGG
jgi:hypothetical protein